MNIYSDAIEQLGIFTIVGGILAIVTGWASTAS